jgi:hypothetical protein
MDTLGILLHYNVTILNKSWLLQNEQIHHITHTLFTSHHFQPLHCNETQQCLQTRHKCITLGKEILCFTNEKPSRPWD